MRAPRLRALVVGIAVTAAVASSALGNASAGATESMARSVHRLVAAPHSVEPIGEYRATFGSQTYALTIKKDPGVSKHEGTWKLAGASASGTWVVSGSTIGMITTKGINRGLVLVGTITAEGISSAQAAFVGSGVMDWSAERANENRPAPVATSPIARGLVVSGEPGAAKKAAGRYAIELPDATSTAVLTLANDGDISSHEGNATFKFPMGPRVDAVWLVRKTDVVIGVSANLERGTVFVGTVTKTGISSVDEPGIYGVARDGTFRWYGRKLQM